MKKFYTYILFSVSSLLILTAFSGEVFAQQSLTLEQAIDKALQKNYAIRIARERFDMADISNTWGMAGALPQVSLQASHNQSLTSINQEYASSPDIQISNAHGFGSQAQLQAGIPLFNGFRVIASKEQLEALRSQSELLLNAQVQNTMASVMVLYYDIIRQQKYLQILRYSLDVAKERYTIVSYRRQLGLSNDADVFQAHIDVVNGEQSIKLQQTIIAQAKAELLYLIGETQQYDFSVHDTIAFAQELNYAQIAQSIQKNPEYLALYEQSRVQQAIVRQMHAQRYPSVKLSTAYQYSNSAQGYGAVLKQEMYGPQLGISLHIPLYTGSQLAIETQLAKRRAAIQSIEMEQRYMSLQNDAYTTFLAYENAFSQLAAQQENFARSEQLLFIVMKRFEANMATMLDVKAAQLSYETAGYVLANHMFAAKTAEIELQRLCFTLSY